MKKYITGIRTMPYRNILLIQVDRFVPNSVPPVIETRLYKYDYMTQHIYTTLRRFTFCIGNLNLRIIQEMRELNKES